MSDYLTLHNLESTETPFTVQRIIDEVLQESSDCQLPDNTPLDISLPNLNIDLPPLDCVLNIDIPLVPLPYFCTPSVSGDIVIIGNTSASTTPSISADDTSECDYLMTGIICIPEVSSNISVSTSGTYLSVSGSPVTSSPSGDCGYEINGTITIEDSWSCSLLSISYPSPSPITPSITYGSGSSKMALSTSSSWTGCALTLGISPALTLSIDCSQFGLDISGDGSGSGNVIYGTSSTTTTNLGASVDGGSGCGNTLSFDPEVDVTIDCGEFVTTYTDGPVSGTTHANSTGYNNVSLAYGPNNNSSYPGTLNIYTDAGFQSSGGGSCGQDMALQTVSVITLPFYAINVTICDGGTSYNVRIPVFIGSSDPSGPYGPTAITPVND